MKYIITLSELKKFRAGVLRIFLLSIQVLRLTINENADPTVRKDFESHFNKMVPENAAYYRHTTEGSDDMPAHLKASILGSSITIPITDGKF